jgi:hypothetical protein
MLRPSPGADQQRCHLRPGRRGVFLQPIHVSSHLKYPQT